eukprot:Skav207236  [mRNA]  locus=scaffold523:118248:119195:+ [translate_table: standard]
MAKAIIVSDVGRSLAFYTEIIGFQQILRPNLDHYGAWLTLGNLELHLIEGVPKVPTARDLIVSHIALETDYPHKVLEKLVEFGVGRKSQCQIPRPDPELGGSRSETSEDKITRFFVRDPDGYLLEICSHDIRTAFCFFKEKDAAAEKKPGNIPKYNKLMDAMLGQVKCSVFRLPQLFKTILMAHRWLKNSQHELSKSFEERRQQALSGVVVAAQADPGLLAKFMVRQKTCCDICHGFSKEDLAVALCRSGNDAPTALLLLMACHHYLKVYSPHRYFLSDGRIQEQPKAVWSTRKMKLRLIWSSVDTVFARTRAEP